MTNEALLDALERLEGTGPEFEGFLANHGPMAAEALVRIGASDQVPTWVETYRRRLDTPPEPLSPIDRGNWREALGDVRRAGDWTAFMRREALDQEWVELLLTWWPRLLPGLAASATHGVIRTAHAVRSLTTSGQAPDALLVDELAQGLALWAARYQLLPGSPRLRGTVPATTALDQLPRLDADVPSEGPGVAGRLRAVHHVAGLPEGLEAWASPADPDEALDELIGAAARVLVARTDAPIAFCHTVTAPAAVRMVLPLLPVDLQHASVAASWQVVGAIVAAFAWPLRHGEFDLAEGPPAPDVGVLVAAAVEHGDEHVIKLTEAAIRESARTQDSLLLQAADAFRHRIPPT